MSEIDRKAIAAEIGDLIAHRDRLCDENLDLNKQLHDALVRANRAESAVQQIRKLVAASADLKEYHAALHRYDHPEDEYELVIEP